MSKLIHEILGFDSPIKGDLGVEIEMEGPSPFPNIRTVWKNVPDGSLRGYSAEYVLRKPIMYDKLPDAIDKLKTELRHNGSSIQYSFRAGVHVHVNVNDLTLYETVKFASLYYVLEDYLLSWCGDDRNGNMFCLGLSHAEHIINFVQKNLLYSRFTLQNRVRYLNNNKIRYAALNWCSLYKFGSLEFRALPTTEDLDIVILWCNVLLNLKEVSKSYNTISEIFEDLSKYDIDQWLLKVMPEDFPVFSIEEKTNKIFQGMWNVQEFGYSIDEIKLQLTEEIKKDYKYLHPDKLQKVRENRDHLLEMLNEVEQR